MTRLRLLTCTLALVILSACTRQRQRDIPAAPLAALQSAEHFELLSIDPDDSRVTDLAASYQGYRILGRTTVIDAATRAKLIEALRTAARESDGNAASCFNPRHGIRVTRAGAITDFVICFECFQAQIYSGTTKTHGFLLTASAQPTFDAVLKAANVPLPPPAR